MALAFDRSRGRLEQRDDAQRGSDAGSALEVLDGEDVGRLARHRDHVRAERSRVADRNEPESIEHLLDLRGAGAV